MKPIFFILPAISLSAILSTTLIAQQTHDSTFFKQAVDHLLENYKKEMGANSLLYNGPEYVRNGRRATGFPFFESDDMLTGSINYNGVDYRNVEMHYDLVSDQVIVHEYNKASISLVNEKIGYFSILDHHFLKLAQAASITGLKPGFYELMYMGRTPLLARREKKLIFPSNTEEEPKYTQYNFYYIKKGNNYFVVDSKNSLLDVLKDKKDLLKKYIKAEKLNFNKHFEDALKKTIAYYDQVKS
ncbi:MAG TPA: hypothetical protein VHZ50_07545 [Puia sp.]|nr:hypothetical protein [Puia sp.]